MICRNFFFSLAVLLAGVGPALIGTEAAVAIDIVAVCPSEYRDGFQAWVDHREQDGLTVAVIENHPDARSLLKSIQRSAAPQTRYVVLVGGSPAIGTTCDPTREIPTTYSPTTVTAKYGSTPTLSSDMPYGDFDQDGIPNAVVGRFPVNHKTELKNLIDRIIRYEQNSDFGLWRGDLQLVGGIGGFGGMVDTAIETVTRTIVTGVLPAETRTTVAYASPNHRFFPKSKSFTEAVIENYNRGSRFWVYAGHGQVTQLDRVPASAEGRPVLDRDSVGQLNCAHAGSPIALLLACYTGAIDAPESCFAERMLLADGGPVAVIAGSRVTMPYGNATAAIGLIDGVYHKKETRLGDAWLSTLVEMQRDAVTDRSTPRMMVDSLAAMISPAGTNLVEERREHTRLYNLLGDPTLRLHPPQTIDLKVAPGYHAGETITIESTSSIDGEITMTLDRPLGSPPVAATSLGSSLHDDDDPNETSIASVTQQVTANQVNKSVFVLPLGISGPLTIRALIAGEKTWATAAGRTIIHQHKH
ncbi:C25 family cysteine peptidase [Novipirellula galeiformis]|nr:C25 family cysteine peptidase [Novipirellula galeiformis]